MIWISGDAGFFRFARDGLDDRLDHGFVIRCGNSNRCAGFTTCSRRDRRKHDRARTAFGVIRRLLALFRFARLGTRDRELATHEGLIVKHLNAANRVIHVEHLHKTVTFRAMRRAVVNDLHAADWANAFEQFLKVLLSDIVGQVADINAGGLYRRRISTARALGIAAALTLAGLGRALGGACVAGVGLCSFRFAVGFAGFLFARWACGLFVKADELQQLLPPAERFFAAGRAGRLESELFRATRSLGTGAAITAV